jgi:hypothetical protein
MIPHQGKIPADSPQLRRSRASSAASLSVGTTAMKGPAAGWLAWRLRQRPLNRMPWKAPSGPSISRGNVPFSQAEKQAETALDADKLFRNGGKDKVFIIGCR